MRAAANRLRVGASPIPVLPFSFGGSPVAAYASAPASAAQHDGLEAAEKRRRRRDKRTRRSLSYHQVDFDESEEDEDEAGEEDELEGLRSEEEEGSEAEAEASSSRFGLGSAAGTRDARQVLAAPLASSAVPTLPPPAPALSSWSEEMRALWSSASQAIIGSSLSSLLAMVDLVIVGQALGTDSLAAASLASSYFNLTTVLVSGLAAAIDGACSSAIAKGDTREAGLVLQRGVLLSVLASVPTMIALSFAGHVLHVVFDQTKPNAVNAAMFCDSLILGLLPYGLFLAVTKWLSSQGVVSPSLYIGGIANCINCFLSALLVHTDGFMGSPLAASICRLLQLLLVVGYVIRWKPYRRTGAWAGWDLPEAVGDYLATARLGWTTLLSALTIAVESWPYDVTVLLSGRHLTNTDVAAHTVLLMLSQFMAVGAPVGLGLAAASRVSHILSGGAGPAPGGRTVGRAAHFSIMCVSCVGIVYMFICAMATLVGRSVVGRLFSSDPAVTSLVSSLALVSAVYQTVDGYQITLGAALRGVSRAYDKWVWLVNAAGWWLVGIPIGWWCAGSGGGGGATPGGTSTATAAVAAGLPGSVWGFALPSIGRGGEGIAGIWWGMLAAVTFNAIGYTVLFRVHNWDAHDASSSSGRSSSSSISSRGGGVGAGAGAAGGAGAEAAAASGGAEAGAEQQRAAASIPQVPGTPPPLAPASGLGSPQRPSLAIGGAGPSGASPASSPAPRPVHSAVALSRSSRSLPIWSPELPALALRALGTVSRQGSQGGFLVAGAEAQAAGGGWTPRTSGRAGQRAVAEAGTPAPLGSSPGGQSPLPASSPSLLQGGRQQHRPQRQPRPEAGEESADATEAEEGVAGSGALVPSGWNIWTSFTRALGLGHGQGSARLGGGDEDDEDADSEEERRQRKRGARRSRRARRSDKKSKKREQLRVLL